MGLELILILYFATITVAALLALWYLYEDKAAKEVNADDADFLASLEDRQD